MSAIRTAKVKTASAVLYRICACVFLASVLSACFTGVESTPRIDAGEVRRQQAVRRTSEQLFLSGLVAKSPSQWRPGESQWRIADARFARVLAPASDIPDSIVGRVITFLSWTSASTLTGDDASDICFIDKSDSTKYLYRVGIPAEALDTVSALEVPFAVDLSLVSKVDSMMRGRKLFVSTPDWFDGSGNDVSGLRHVEVSIDSVVPGSYIYPAAVYFTLVDPLQVSMAGIDSTETRKLYMSVGGIGASSRSFDRLFAFENPRRRFPAIEDDVWNLIICSRVRSGMTRDECRLALGSPTVINRYPTRGGMREVWNYSDGVYLAFDDGFLSSFRQ